MSPEGGVEPCDVVGVAGHDYRSESMSAHGHMAVDNVSRIGRGQQETDPSGIGGVHGDHIGIWHPQQSTEADLTAGVTPRLTPAPLAI